MKGHYVFQRRVLAAGMCLLLIGILMSSLVWAVSPSSAPPAQDTASAGEQAAPDVAPAQAGSRSARLDPPNPKRAVREAWEKARDAGVYAFATDLTEVTYPARTLSNVGRSPQRAELHLEGEIDQPARTMSFRLSQPGLGTSSETGNEVRVEGDRAYTRQAGGEWQEVQDFTSSFAPDNDPLAFLAGIQNIADCELQARSPAQVACYRFDMDGPALAAYLRDRLERELAEAGELPQSVSLDAPASVRDMTGYGELWVDGRGLPLRLTAHLVFPEQPDGSYSVADVQTNLSGFPEETAAAPAFSSDPVAWTGAALGLDDPSLPARAAKTGGIGGVAACSLVAMALLLAHRRSRRLYVAIVLAVILSMVVVPLIESERVVAFFEHQEARAQDPMTLGADGQLVDAQTAQEQEAARQALADSLEPTWDPQQDLLAQAPTAPQTTEVGLTTSLGSGQASSGFAGQTALGGVSAIQPPVSVLTSSLTLASLDVPLTTVPACNQEDTADSDNDGVNDYEECVYDLTLNDNDTDNDGLTDGQELNKLGTNPTLADTDRDLITDTLEVKGFSLGGKMWYLDPNNPDTNGDQLVDSAECLALVQYANPTEAQIKAGCDTDGDNIPNPFEADNDADGVPDSEDLSPDRWVDTGGLRSGPATAAVPFNRDNPFKLSAVDLQANWPVLVDVQFRPTTPAHLGYAMNVLDWPEGDVQGQIQHGDDDTFAYGDNPDIQDPDDTAGANGDMRLVPLLEIVMTGTKVPLKLTTAVVTVIVGSGTAVSSTVALRPSPTNSADTQITFLSGASLKVYVGTCADKGAQVGTTFTQTPATVSSNAVAKLADGNHAVVVTKETTSACADLPDLVSGPYSDKMVDTSVLDPYGISVKEGYGTDDTNLVAYVPLDVVPDDTGGGKAAFQARMLYWVGDQSSWSEPAQMRVVWLVEMITDTCADSADLLTWDEYKAKNPDATRTQYNEYFDAYCLDTRSVEQTQLVQIYDESWYVTGVSVQEAHGLDVAVAYPNPEQAYNEDPLWTLAWGLSRQFITGRDCETATTIFSATDPTTPACSHGNKVRDLAVYKTDRSTPARTIGDSTIEERFHNTTGYNDHRSRWGIDRQALKVKSFRYDHQDYLGLLAMTETPDILDDYSTTVTPTLLFAYEERARRGDLEDLVPAAAGSGVLTIDMNTGEHKEETSTGIKWAPFRYNETVVDGKPVGWEAFPSDEYWTAQETDLTESFQALFSTDSAATTLGRVITARSYTVGLIVGVGGPVYCTPDDQRCPTNLEEGASDKEITTTTTTMKSGLNRVTVEVMSEFMEAKKHIRTNDTPFDWTRKAQTVELRENVTLMTQGTVWTGVTHPETGFFEALGEESLSSVASPWQTVYTSGPPLGMSGGMDISSSTTGLIAALKASEEARLLMKEIVYYVYETVYAGIGVGLFVKAAYQLTSSIVKITASSLLAGCKAAMGFAKNAKTKGGVLGIAITVVIILAAWAKFGIYAGLAPGSMAMDEALVGAIATMIVSIILTIITTFLGPIGSLITMVKMLINALAASLCHGLLTEQQMQKEEWTKWVCGGITGLLEQIIVSLLYSGTILVDMDPYEDDPWYPRLDTYNLEPTVVQVEDGMVVGSTMRYTVGVTNTIMLVDVPFGGHESAWNYQFSDENLAKANFTYKWQKAEEPLHDPLGLGGMQWDGTSNGAPFYHTETVASTDEWELTRAGINLPMENLYLSEGYAVPEQECWGLGLIKYCYIPAEKDTIHYDMGASMRHDVLPATLDGFYALTAKGDGYALAWGQEGDLTFPTLEDADGDGVSRMADLDDSKWDADGDTLADDYEAANGMDSLMSDHDRDGLTDLQEVRLGTDPWSPDSDGDGLLDCQEVLHQVVVAGDEATRQKCGGEGTWSGGWTIVYKWDAGNPVNTLVTSNPLVADTDGDGLTDRQEMVYGYNPRAYSILNVLSLDSTLSEAGQAVSDSLVAPGQTLSYSASVKNELDNRRAEGLLATTVDPDVFTSSGLQPKSFRLWPFEQTSMTGDTKVWTTAASGTYSVTQVAGALIVDPTVESGKATLWLPFDDAAGSTVFADQSGYGHDGKCVGTGCTLQPAGGHIGGAVQLGGAGYVEVAIDVSETAYALSLWFKTTCTTCGIFSVDRLTAPDHDRHVYLKDGNVYARVWENETIYTSGTNCADGQWHHVVHTFGGTEGGQKLYLDGVQRASGLKTFSNFTWQDGINIGFSVDAGQDYLTGSIDDVRVFDSALTAAQVQDLYDLPLFRADFNDGSTWKDVSYSPTTISPGTAEPTHGAGFAGNYASLDGTQYLSVASASKLNLSSGRFTLAAWIYPRTRGGKDAKDTFAQAILGLNSGTSSAYPTLQRVGRKIRFSLGTGSAWQTPYESGEVLTENQWNHVALTLDKEDSGGTLRLYVNGGLVDTQPFTATPLSTATSFEIGRSSSKGTVKVSSIYVRIGGDSPLSTTTLHLLIGGQQVWYQDFTGFPKTFSIDQSRDFTQSTNLTMWEDDTNQACYPNDTCNFTGVGTEIPFNTNSPGYGSKQYDFTGCGAGEGLHVAYDNNSIPFYGYMDELQIFGRPLDPLSVRRLFLDIATLVHLPLDEAPGAAEFQDTSRPYVPAYCSGSTCPTLGTGGRMNLAANFEKVKKSTIQLDHSSANELTASFTVAAWIKQNSSADTQRIVSTARTKTQNGWGFGVSAGNLIFDPYGYGRSSTSSLGLQTGRWYHVAAVVNADYTVTFYVDGSKVQSTSHAGTYGAAADTDDPLLIGATQAQAAAAPSEFFDGRIDDVSIINTALPASRIADLYESAPVLHLRFDEALGATQFADNAAYNRFGTCTYEATCPQTGTCTCPQAGEAVRGQMGLAAQFDGQDDKVQVESFGTFTRATVSAWVYRTGATQTRETIVSYKESLPGGLVLDLNDDGTNHYPRFYVHVGGWKSVTADKYPVPLNQWVHLAGTYDGRTIRLYYNGSLVAESDDIVGTMTQGTATTGIGSRNETSPHWFPGLIDEVQIYGRALAGSEISDQYDYGSAWIEDRQTHQITVDHDDPTATVAIDDRSYLANQPIWLELSANDPTSEVDEVSLGTNWSMHGIAWTEAAHCADTADRPEGAWCARFEPLGEGDYALLTRATDRVGNQGDAAVAGTIYVDDGAPNITLSQGALQRVDALESQVKEGTWVVSLPGTVVDPEVWAGQWNDLKSPGSGVPPDGVHVTLSQAGDPERKALGDAAQAATVASNGEWSLGYEFSKPHADGCYEMEVEAVDRVSRIPGLSSDQILRHTSTAANTIVLDASAPSVLLNQTQAIAGGTLGPAVTSLDGAASDRPVLVQVDLTGGTNAPLARVWLTCQHGTTSSWYTLFDVPQEKLKVGGTLHWQGEIHQGSTCQVKLTTSAASAVVSGSVQVCDEQKASWSDGVSASSPKTVAFVADSTTCLAPGCTANLKVAGVQGADVAYRSVLPGSAFVNEFPLQEEVLRLAFEDTPSSNDTLTLRSVGWYAGPEGTCDYPGGTCPTMGQPGPAANAGWFDGKDYVNVTSSYVNLGGGKFTQAVWINPQTTAKYAGVLGFQPASNQLYDRTPSIYLYYGKSLHIGFGNGTDWKPFYVYNKIHAGWNHVATTFDGQLYKVYVDGSLVYTDTTNAGRVPVSVGQLDVGRIGTNYYKGGIDEVRIFTFALTPEQIRALYLGTGSLLALPFDEPWVTGGDILADASGRGHDGTLSTGTSDTAIKSVSGQVGSHALKLDGTDDYVSAGSGVDVANHSFTAAFWAKREAGLQEFVLSQGPGGTDKFLHIGFRSGTKFTCAFYGDDLDVTITQDTNWHHWACTYDSATRTQTVYRDGIQVGQPRVASADYKGTGELIIGRYGTGSYYFKGLLDDLRIYPRALPAVEVADLVHAGWQAATLGDSIGAERTTWTATVPAGAGTTTAPAGLEGAYEIEMRGRDVAGHAEPASERSVLWRGEVDTTPPRIKFSYQIPGVISNYYNLDIVDFNLTLTNYSSACGLSAITEYFYSPWAIGATGKASLYRIYGDPCYGSGNSVTACDTFGNCTTCNVSGTCTYSVPGGAAASPSSGEDLGQAVVEPALAGATVPGASKAAPAAKPGPAGFDIIAPAVVTTSQYYEPRTVDVVGQVTSKRKPGAGQHDLISVQVAMDQDAGPAILSEPAAQRPYTVTWTFPWHLPIDSALPDGVAYTAVITATDLAGRTTVVRPTLTADLVLPTPVTLTLAANGLPVEPGAIIREPTADLALTWTPSSDGSGLAPYLAAWRFEDAYTTNIQTSLHDPAGPREAHVTAGEAQRVSVGLASRDVYGNLRGRAFGSVIVDGPLTPDYIAFSPGAEGDITGSTCTLLGADRRIARRTGDDRWTTQRLYGTWDHQALRLAWTGAHWSGDGDLFVYLDTVPGGTSTTFAPYAVAVTGTLVTLPADMEADVLIWVQDASTASLLRWDGSAWVLDTGLSPDQYRFDGGRGHGQTDLYLPFDLLGTAAGAELGLLAFAAEEPAPDVGLRVWATLPLANPLNSERVNSRRVLAAAASTMPLLHEYRWAAVGDGVCPNGTNGVLAAQQHNDAMLDLTVESDPPGAAASGVAGGLFWVADPGVALTVPATEPSFGFLRAGYPPVPNGQAIAYTVHYHNEGSHTLAGASLVLSASGAVSMAGDTIELGDIPPGGEGSVQFQATADRSLSTYGLGAVVGRLYAANNGDTPLEWLAVLHRVDQGAPEEMGLDLPDLVVGPAAGWLRGFAHDESGISQVEIEITSPSGAIQTLTCEVPDQASGGWSCPWDATVANGGLRPADGDQFTVRIRATDRFGTTSPWSAPHVLRVDAQPPSLALAEAIGAYAGRVVRGNALRLAGESLDNHAVGSVTVCLDDGTCRTADLSSPGAASSGWSRWMFAPGALDYVTRTLTIQAADRLGNSLLEPLAVPVVFDNVPPLLTANQLLAQVPLGSEEIVLSGDAGDGGPAVEVSVRVQSPESDLTRERAARQGSAWSFILPAELVGQYTLWADAKDVAGNITTAGPFTVTVTCTDAAPVVTSLDAEPMAGSAISLTLTVVISNAGPAPLPAGITATLVEGVTELGQVVTTVPLAAGESEALSLVWAPEGTRDYDIGVTARQDAALPDGPLCVAPGTALFSVSLRDAALDYGWNLISPPLHPGNTDVEVVQRGIVGDYTALLGYDGGLLAYYPDRPGDSTLTTVDGLHGYWIHTPMPLPTDPPTDDPAARWRMVGKILPEDLPLSLASGWNLVSYLPRQPLTVTTALESIAGQYGAVLGFDGTAASYYPDLDPSYNTLAHMAPGYGYWISATQAITLAYPVTGITETLSLTATQMALQRLYTVREAESLAGVQPTYEWMNFYGELALPDGTPVPTGTVALAVDPQGVLCGATVAWQPGQYGLLACYGDDPATEADEGALPGDLIQFFLSTDGTQPDGQFIGAGLWTAHGDRYEVEEGALPVVDLAITMEAAPQAALPGETITYTLRYWNAGDSVAQGAAISEILPAEIEATGYAYSGATLTPVDGGEGLAWEVEDLEPGAGGIITVTALLSPELTGPLAITNTAFITAPLEAWPEDNVAQAVLQVIEGEEAPPPVVDLVITKGVVPLEALPGAAITYTLLYWNAGDAAAQGVVINEVLPAEIEVTGYTYSGAEIMPVDGGEGLAWQVADLEPGAGGNITVTAQLSPELTGPLAITNTAFITAPLEAWPEDNVAQAVLQVIEVEEVPPPVVDLVITKEVVPQEALPGAAITYTLLYWNAGDLAAEGVIINEVLPPEITVTGYTYWGAQITPVADSQPFVWQVADLEPGAGGIITVTAQLSPELTDAMDITNTAVISAPLEGQPEDNVAEAILHVILGLASLRLPILHNPL